jgi:Uncharacterized conserved protein
MCEMLLSINPKYVEKIINGEKIYEFRKTKTKRIPDKIIIYCTSPIMKVIGEAEVAEVLIDTPQNIWVETRALGGVDEEFFFKYYNDKEVAVAYKLKNIKKYKKEKKLSDYGLKVAPQSFVYL